MLELEKKSSVAVTFTLFVNANIFTRKISYCVLRRLLALAIGLRAAQCNSTWLTYK